MMPGSRLCIVIVLIAFVAATGYAQENTITPGASVGPVKLGDSKQRLVEVLGKPDLEGFTDGTPKDYVLQYYKLKLTFLVRGGKIHSAMVLNPSYHTPQGLGITSTVGEVEAACGKGYSRKDGVLGPELTYGSAGVRFLFNGDHVFAIEIRPPGN